MDSETVNEILEMFDLQARWRQWSLRLIFSALLMTFSEIIMWENPVAHTPQEWVGRAVLYFALGSVLIDLTVRFQAREIAVLAMVSGLYGLLSGVLVTRDALSSLPLSLIVHALGLQTGAGLYALLFFLLVMRGRQPRPLEIGLAGAVGVLWGIWVKWYPAQPSVGWGVMTIETATLYLIAGAVLTGALLLWVGRSFQVVREEELQLNPVEWVIVVVPLAIAFVAGLLTPGVIPIGALLIVIGIGAVMVVALLLQKVKFEPSVLAEILFSAPNPSTFVILGVVFLVAGTISAAIIGDDRNSIIGAAAYIAVGAVGLLWLPAASALIGLRAYQRDRAENQEDSQ
ncbi:MAG: hypothetical protein ACYDBJ_06400 [Aggregatilineales bacterium]